jgi:hypothetical protein
MGWIYVLCWSFGGEGNGEEDRASKKEGELMQSE